MRRSIAFAIAVFVLSSASWGEDAPAVGRLASQTGWATFGVVEGRLAVLGVPPKCERSTTCADPESRISETLCVKAESGFASVHYQFVSPGEQVTIEASGGRVEMHRTPAEGSSLVEWRLVQAPGRDLVLTIGSGDSRREYSAPTFWHAMLAEPDVARDCLTPLLETLRPDWGLRRQAAEIERRLLELAAEAPAPDAQHWQALVAQLGEPTFLRRESAERQLRAAGQAIVPFLDQLDRRRLDAEQRARLAGVRRSLAGRGEDTPGRIAARMVYDHSAWLILLTREDATERAAAARHLCKLCPEAVNFDPQADQAVRRAQLKQLRQQLARD